MSIAAHYHCRRAIVPTFALSRGTDTNGVIFDTANNSAGCVPAFMISPPGPAGRIWCLDPTRI